MFSFVSSAIISGIDGVIVQTEADVSDGLPMFDMVGFLASEVRESKERVRTALKNCGYILPAKRITVNLSPANIKKQGSGFDLPITIAVLSALEKIPEKSTENTLFIGEMSLNGDINAVSGILPIVLKAKEEGFKTCVIPYANAREASIVEGISIIPVKSITEAIGYCKGEFTPTVFFDNPISQDLKCIDFSDVNGQALVRRACEIAVTGLHNLLLVGPPGAGKSMIAQRIPTILPDMSFSEQIEVTRIYSVCGKLEEAGGLITKRPFRSPHHT
ncbi:MAG: ATP-binding protein, partial [Lachnospiraceae bacterium]|nr:ATP-binding protein [Lachnospiraceae bacterium]